MAEEQILAGAEPLSLPGGEDGVLVIHGFTGSTQSMRPLAEALHAAGFTVLAPRLAGHGVSVEAMARIGARDWVGSVEAAFAELRGRCGRIFVAGLSMGGTLTLYTAAIHAAEVAGAIPINAVVRLDNPDLAAFAYMAGAPPVLPGIGSDIKRPGVQELAYPGVPSPCIAELYGLVGATHALLPRVTCPTLIVTSREDHVVPPENAGFIAQRIGAERTEQLWLDNSYHVATLDNDADRIAEAAIRFIRGVGA